MALLLALAVFTASQGGVVQLTFPDEPGVKSVEIVWENNSATYLYQPCGYQKGKLKDDH